MVYTLGNQNGLGYEDYSFRDFWTRSYGGRFAASYTEGFATGKADLEANSFAGLDALTAIEVSKRDNAWEAKVDGYAEATKSRGPIVLRPATGDRTYDPR